MAKHPNERVISALCRRWGFAPPPLRVYNEAAAAEISVGLGAPKKRGGLRHFALLETFDFWAWTNDRPHPDLEQNAGTPYLERISPALAAAVGWNGSSARYGRQRSLVASLPHDKDYWWLKTNLLMGVISRAEARRLRRQADRRFALNMLLYDNQPVRLVAVCYIALRLFGGRHAGL